MRMKSNVARISQGWLAQSMAGVRKAVRPRTSLILLIALVACVTCANAQQLIGSPGAGWQTWTAAADAFGNPIDLNSNGAPYWDVPWGASGSYGGGLAEKNVGFCLTSTGDCQGIGSALFAPGAVAFWGMPYDSASDTGGARDNKVYFNSTGGVLFATLYLNASANPREINQFGWFETNSTGTVNGPKHLLFQGSGEPPGTLTPDPVGKTVRFQPTAYFGFYYSDVSEPACPDGTSEPCTVPGPLHGCYASTIFSFNDPRCTEAAGGQGDHDFAVFNQNLGPNPTYWIAGEDPADCTNFDGDCNLTLVKVTQEPGTPQLTINPVSLLRSQSLPVPMGTTVQLGTFTLSSTGFSAATLISFAIGGANAGDFAIAPGTTCVIGEIIPIGSPCTIVINFTPTSNTPARRDAALTVNSISSQPVRNLSLRGFAQ